MGLTPGRGWELLVPVLALLAAAATGAALLALLELFVYGQVSW